MVLRAFSWLSPGVIYSEDDIYCRKSSTVCKAVTSELFSLSNLYKGDSEKKNSKHLVGKHFLLTMFNKTLIKSWTMLGCWGLNLSRPCACTHSTFCAITLAPGVVLSDKCTEYWLEI